MAFDPNNISWSGDMQTVESSTTRQQFPQIATFPTIVQEDKIRFSGPASDTQKFVLYGKSNFGQITFSGSPVPQPDASGYYTIKTLDLCGTHALDKCAEVCDVAESHLIGGGGQFDGDQVTYTPIDPQNPVVPVGTDYLVHGVDLGFDQASIAPFDEVPPMPVFVPCSTITKT
jgi:hypothetical protein